MSVLNHRDLAAACGVSTATISRALGDSPHVRPEIREKVRSMARELGYQPDPRLALLSRRRWERGRKSDSVVLAVLTDRYTTQRKEKFRDLTAEGARLGYTIERIQLEPARLAGRKLDRELYQRGIRGVLIDLHDPAVLPDLDWTRFCVVMMGEERPELPFFRVATDWRQVFDLHCQNALATGRQRVGIALVRYQGPAMNRMMLAEALLHREELCQAGAADVPLHRYEAEHPKSPAAFRLWAKTHRLDAIIVNDTHPVAWLSSSARDRLQHVALNAAQIERGDPGTDLCLGERLAAAVRILHELVLTDRRGFASAPTRTLHPVLWRSGRT